MKPAPIVAILVLAFLLRLIWVVFIDVVPISDSEAYQIYARNIIEHGVFGLSPEQPGAFWAVGAPAIYAASYAVFGYGSFAVIVVNMLASAIVIFLIHRLGKMWFDDMTGLLAAGFFSIWPTMIQLSSVIASELSFLAALLAGLYFWEKARTDRFFANILASSLLFSAATYIRPIAELIPIVLLLLALVRRERPFWRAFIQTAVVIVVVVATTTPWEIRNERLFGTSVGLTTNFGPNFWMGNHLGTTGGYAPLPSWTAALNEAERSEKLKQEAIGYIRSKPIEFVKRTVLKSLILHDRETIGVAWNRQEIVELVGQSGERVLKWISTLFWYAMLLLALAAAPYFILIGQASAVLYTPPLILIAYFTAVHAVIVVQDRYHIPENPLIGILAAALIVSSCRRRSRPGSSL